MSLILLVTSLPTTKYYFFTKRSTLVSCEVLLAKTSCFILGLEVKEKQLSLKCNGYLPGLLYLRHFLVVLRHWNVKERRIQSVAMVIIRDIFFQISVCNCRDPFFLKSRKILLAYFTLSSLLLTFFKRRSSRRMFLLRTKEYYCTFSNKCFQEIMWSLGVLYFQMQRDISGRRRIVLLAKKPHRDKPEQNME